MKDWNGSFQGDCFDVAAKITNIRINTGLGFNLLLEKIAYDFKLHIFNKGDLKIKQNFEYKYQEYKKTFILNFKVIPRKFNKIDEIYWYNKHNVSSDILKKAKVIPIQELFVEDYEGYLQRVYTYSSNNPGYAYYGGKKNNVIQWITYFPFEKASRNKHKRNASFVNGYQMITCGRVLIITKAFKDVLVYKSFNIDSIAVPNENYVIDKDTMFILKQRYDIILTNFDFDYTGIKLANKYKKIHRINSIMFTNGKYNTNNYGAKDISDFIIKFGKNYTLKLLNNIIDKNKDILDYYNKKDYNVWKTLGMT